MAKTVENKRNVLAKEKPPMLREIDAYTFEHVHCSTQLPSNHDKPIVFEIEKAEGQFIDLSRMYMKMKFRVFDGDGKGLAVSDPPTAFISAPIYSFFRDLSISFNGTPVYWTKNMFGYYAHIMQLLKLPDTDRVAAHSAALFYDDNFDMMPVYNEDQVLAGYRASLNTRVNERMARLMNGNEVETMGRLLADIANQNKLIRDDVSIRIVLQPAPVKFCLLSSNISEDTSFTIQITEAICIVPRVTIGDRFLSGQPKPSEYYYVEHDLNMFSLPSGATNFSRAFYTGAVPRRILLLMVAEEAFNGHLHRGPFRFHHYDVDSCQLVIGGTRKVPLEPLKMSFENYHIVEAYMKLLNSMRRSLGSGLPFDLTQYKFGHVLLAFDLTPDHSSGSAHWSPGSKGATVVNLHFSKPLPENVSLICIAEFEKTLHLDQDGRPTVGLAPPYD